MYLDIVKLKRNQKFRKYSAVCKYHYLEIGVTCLQNVNDLILGAVLLLLWRGPEVLHFHFFAKKSSSEDLPHLPSQKVV